MTEHWRQSPEWEELFQTVINKAKRCPATALCFSNSITAEKVEDAAGNHVFDDHFYFWEITENQGHQLRSVFQHYSCRRDEGFKEYITDLIDDSGEAELRKTRIKA